MELDYLNARPPSLHALFQLLQQRQRARLAIAHGLGQQFGRLTAVGRPWMVKGFDVDPYDRAPATCCRRTLPTTTRWWRRVDVARWSNTRRHAPPCKPLSREPLVAPASVVVLRKCSSVRSGSVR